MKKAKCMKCGYAWETNSNMKYVSCPNCLSKVLIKYVDKQEARR